jgi:hypothetical protein
MFYKKMINEFFDDGSNSSIIMYRRVEYLGPVSDIRHILTYLKRQNTLQNKN